MSKPQRMTNYFVPIMLYKAGIDLLAVCMVALSCCRNPYFNKTIFSLYSLSYERDYKICFD